MITRSIAELFVNGPKRQRPGRHAQPAWDEAFVKGPEALLVDGLLQAVKAVGIVHAFAIVTARLIHHARLHHISRRA